MSIPVWNTYSVSEKTRRLERIAELVGAGGVASQDQLQRLLRARGLRATQGTLSKDLKDLGVLKGPGGYTLPAAADHPAAGRNGTARGRTPRPSIPPAAPPPLADALRSFLVRGGAGGSMAVLQTGPGRAPMLALEIDRARLEPVVGTIAGDDTVFVATRSPRAAATLVREFKQLARLS